MTGSLPAPSPGVPASAAELTPAWLAAALGRSLPPGTTVERETIGVGYGLSAALTRCRWTTAEGGTGSVVVKLWDTTGVAGVREVDFYRDFGRAPKLRIPACFHGAVDEATHRGVLVLEDLGDVVQGDCLEQLPAEAAAALAREMAAFHGAWWDHRDVEAAGWLPDASRLERPPGWFEDRTRGFHRRFPDRLDPFCRSLVDRAEELHERSNAMLAGAPATLLHADLHLDNVVFEGPDRRPVVLDWARVAKGPAALDTVWLMFEVGRAGDMERTLDAYLAALETRSGVRQDEAAWRGQLGGALLRRFQSWTLGLVMWEPTAEREKTMIENALRRVSAAAHAWREKDPDLFAV